MITPFRILGLVLLALVAAVLAWPVLLSPPATIGSQAAATASEPVTVWDVSGARPRPCGDVEVGGKDEARGGCEVEVRGRDIALTVKSMVGSFEFVSCIYNHRLHVDGSGRTYMAGILAAGERPCNDARACMAEDRRAWRGQIEAAADGRLYNVVQACFDTCIGQFRGELRLELTRDGDRWRMAAERDSLDASGLEVDGRWTFPTGAIEIRRGDRAVVPPPAPPLADLPIEISDSGAARDRATIEAPATVPAGRVAVELTNSGARPHAAQLVRVDRDARHSDVVYLVNDTDEGDPTPDWLHPAGGPALAAPGRTTSSVELLEPGRYFIVDTETGKGGDPDDFGKGGVRELRVTGRPRRARLARAPARIVGLDHGFRVSGLRAGANRVRVDNRGRQIHQPTLIPLAEGATLADARRALGRWEDAIAANEGLPDGGPLDYAGLRRLMALDGGRSQITTVELDPGRYVLLCLQSDRLGGNYHWDTGALRLVTIR